MRTHGVNLVDASMVAFKKRWSHITNILLTSFVRLIIYIYIYIYMYIYIFCRCCAYISSIFKYQITMCE